MELLGLIVEEIEHSKFIPMLSLLKLKGLALKRMLHTQELEQHHCILRLKQKYALSIQVAKK